MKKLTTTERKWRILLKQLLDDLEREINIAKQNQSLKELEISINKKEYQKQLTEIDLLLLFWLRDLKFWENLLMNEMKTLN